MYTPSVGLFFRFDLMDTHDDEVSKKRPVDERVAQLTKETFLDNQARQQDVRTKQDVQPKKARHVTFADQIDDEDLDQNQDENQDQNLAIAFLIDAMNDLSVCEVYDASKSAEEHGWILRSFASETLQINPKAALHLTNFDFIHLLTPYPNLTALVLPQGKYLTDFAFTCGLIGRNNVREIDIGFIPQITDSTLAAIADNCPQLSKLTLFKSAAITDYGVQRIAKSCPYLETLHLDWCSEITDKALFFLAQGSLHLKDFSASESSKLTLQGFEALLQGCSQLESVELSGCLQVTDQWLDALVKLSSSLKVLDVERCPKITPFGVGRLKSQFPNIVLLSSLVSTGYLQSD